MRSKQRQCTCPLCGRRSSILFPLCDILETQRCTDICARLWEACSRVEQENGPMARWWTKPPIIVAVLGVLAVIITALLPHTTITQHTSGAGSPAVGSAGRDVTITQQPIPPL